VYLAAGERLNAGHQLYALMPGNRPVDIHPPFWTVPLLSPPPIAVLFRVPAGDVYCCGGCALAHRITGGDSGHGQAVGLLMSVGVGAFLAMNVMMLSFVLYSGRSEADRALGESWVRWALLILAVPALALLGAPFLSRGVSRLKERALDTDALIVLGVAAAFVLSTRSVLAGRGPLYLDTAMGILLFVTIGRYLEAVSRARTTDALAASSSSCRRKPRASRRGSRSASPWRRSARAISSGCAPASGSRWTAS
jgi:hypothetical protein